LLERVPGVFARQNAEGAATVLAEGEASGHCHAIWERVTMFRDDGAGRRIDTCEVTPVIFTEEPEF